MTKLLICLAMTLAMVHAKAADELQQEAAPLASQATGPADVESAASAASTAENAIKAVKTAPEVPTLKAMGPDGKVFEVPADQVEQVQKAMRGAQRMAGAVQTVNAVQSVVQGIAGLFHSPKTGGVMTQRQMLDAASEAAAKHEQAPQGSGLGSLLGLLSH